ncbi:MAG: hypothetical protein HZA04_00210 [Nitrospinae bacterium]|nr:hypothetical protein [Nitrospinota bacterium]
MLKKLAAVGSALALVAMFAGAPLALAIPASAPMAMDMDADCHSHGDSGATPVSSGNGGMAACCGVACHGYAVGPVALVPFFLVTMILAVGYSFFVPPARGVVFYRPPKH